MIVSRLKFFCNCYSLTVSLECIGRNLMWSYYEVGSILIGKSVRFQRGARGLSACWESMALSCKQWDAALIRTETYQGLDLRLPSQQNCEKWNSTTYKLLFPIFKKITSCLIYVSCSIEEYLTLDTLFFFLKRGLFKSVLEVESPRSFMYAWERAWSSWKTMNVEVLESGFLPLID